MKNSLGSMSRSSSDEKPRNSVPSTIPTRQQQSSERAAPVNIQR